MPLPVKRNIEIRNAVRKGLYREPIIEFVDEASLRTASPSQLRTLISLGAVSPGRVEEVVQPPAAELAAIARARAARVGGAGDYVTGLSKTVHFERRVVSGPAFFTSLSQAGPHVITDVSVTFMPQADTTAAYDLAIVDVLYSSSSPGTGSTELSLPSIFERTLEPGGSWPGRSGLMMEVGSRPITWAAHIDKYMDLDVVFYTLMIRSLGLVGSAIVNVSLTLREVAAAERAARLPSRQTPVETVSRPPTAAQKTAAVRTSGAPVKKVEKAKDNKYYFYTTQASFVANDAQVKKLLTSYVPLALVPDERLSEFDFNQLRGTSRPYTHEAPLPLWAR